MTTPAVLSKRRVPRRQRNGNQPWATAASPGDARAAWSATLHEQNYAPLKIAALINVFELAGVPSSVLLAGTGIAPAQIGSPMTRTSIQQLLIVGRNAVRHRTCPDLGLRAGLQMHASAYGMYGYALLCTPSMGHAFDMAVRYHRLGTPVMPARWAKDGARAVWMLPRFEDLEHLGLSWDEYLFFLDMQFTIHSTLVKDVMGPWCVPARALFAAPQPDHAEQVAQALECPVSFNQPRSELHYPSQWLDRAPQLANPITAAQMSITCARLMEEFKWQAGVARRVYDELTRTPGRFPQIDTVASSLCMAPRTLRRRLEAEGTSFSGLLSSVRHALAVDYLGTTLLSVEDIALALDFSDTASFRHAFKRWTGKTPKDYRA